MKKSNNGVKTKEIISVCSGMSCSFEFSDNIALRLDRRLKEELIEDVKIVRNRCTGFCSESPIVNFLERKLSFKRVKMEDVEKFIEILK